MNLKRSILGVALVAAGLAAAQAQIREEKFELRPGVDGSQVKSRVHGRESVDYRFFGQAGDILTVELKPSNLSCYFNVLPPRSDSAIFNGSISGNEFRGELKADGSHTIRVYLMGGAASGGGSSDYTLQAWLSRGNRPSNMPSKPQPKPFDQKLKLQDVSFHVTTSMQGRDNILRISPHGLKVDNSPITRKIDGEVSGAEVGDLNADGTPEIYVYVRSLETGGKGALVGYASNKGRSLSEIYMPPLSPEEPAARGYRGGDEFTLIELTFGRRFPIYKRDDKNANPTGGLRQMEYKLEPGEAGWVLRQSKFTDYDASGKLIEPDPKHHSDKDHKKKHKKKK